MTSFTEEKFPNKPERLIKEIYAAQQIIRDQEEYVQSLKRELDSHLHIGTITDKIIFDGVACTRCCKQGKWNYSEMADQFAKKLKKDLDQRLALEREDGIATQDEPTYYWTVRKHGN
tara:strand:- start:526 stop:876 length:351 start_codon:yes stop_codon:yes gene_type:complete